MGRAKKAKRHWQEPKPVQMTREELAIGVKTLEQGTTRFKIGKVSRQIHKHFMSLGISREQALHALECDYRNGTLPIIVKLPDGVTYNPDSEFVIFHQENFFLQKIDKCDLFVYVNAGSLQDVVDITIAKNLCIVEGTLPNTVL